jgi:hypothetical protein
MVQRRLPLTVQTKDMQRSPQCTAPALRQAHQGQAVNHEILLPRASSSPSSSAGGVIASRWQYRF